MIKGLTPDAVQFFHKFCQEEVIKWIGYRQEKMQELEVAQAQVLNLMKEIGRSQYYESNLQNQINIVENSNPELKIDPNKLN